MDRLTALYKGKVKFVFIYGSEGHPGSYDQPDDPRAPRYGTKTYADRVGAAHLFQEVHDVHRQILVDAFDRESVRYRYGIQDGNPLVVIGADERISHHEKYANASALGCFLNKYLQPAAWPR